MSYYYTSRDFVMLNSLTLITGKFLLSQQYVFDRLYCYMARAAKMLIMHVR